jgi:hypothetical protein
MSHAHPVVGGAYPKKQEGELKWVWNLMEPKLVVGGLVPRKAEGKLTWAANAIADKVEKRDGLIPVRYIGTGFMRINRSVFEAIEHLSPEYTVDQSKRKERDYWSVGVYKDRYLSEDWFFCQKCLDVGIPIYADTRIIIKHIGSATYPLRSQLSQITNPTK